MSILRVFPKRTSMTPTDPLAVIGGPYGNNINLKEIDEIHISITFTWDIKKGYSLKEDWEQVHDNVLLGGPAIDGEGGEFTPGMYVKEGITFTSRGCIRKCPWCLVKGPLKLLEIKSGYNIQDNNFLATGREHMAKVFEMLKGQRKYAIFGGGLDTRLIDDWVIEQLRDLKIKQLFLAADTKGALDPLARMVKDLSFLPRYKLRCYVLIAYGDETIKEAEKRLESVWDIGCLPFAQLFQPSDHFIEYSKEWKRFARTWSRPAAMAAIHK